MRNSKYYTVAVEACGGTMVSGHNTAKGARAEAKRLTRTTGREHIAVEVDEQGRVHDA